MRSRPLRQAADLLGCRCERLGSLHLVGPAIEPKRGLEQRHCPWPLLPTRLLPFGLPRMLLPIGDGPSVGEHRSLDVLERDLQEGGDPHDLVERGPADAPQLPALDRPGAHANDLPEPRA